MDIDVSTQSVSGARTLDLLGDGTVPGDVVELDCAWASDNTCKDGVMRGDSRGERRDVP